MQAQPQPDFNRVPVHSLRRYKRQFRVDIKVTSSKADLAQAVATHFRHLPDINEEATISRFLMAARNAVNAASSSKKRKSNAQSASDESVNDEEPKAKTRRSQKSVRQPKKEKEDQPVASNRRKENKREQTVDARKRRQTSKSERFAITMSRPSTTQRATTARLASKAAAAAAAAASFRINSKVAAEPSEDDEDEEEETETETENSGLDKPGSESELSQSMDDRYLTQQSGMIQEDA